MRRLRGAVALALLAVAAGAFADEPAPELGRRAPDFTLPDLAGKRVRLADSRGKKAVLLNFWATWCAPCREEMPTIDKAYQEYKSRGLEILAVSLDAGSNS